MGVLGSTTALLFNTLGGLYLLAILLRTGYEGKNVLEVAGSILRKHEPEALLGMDLEEVVRQTTAGPAAAIGREEELGTLKVGTVADLAAFEIKEGGFDFTDVRDVVETGDRMIAPVMTVREGKVFRPEDLKDELEEAEARVEEMRRLVRGQT